MMSSLHPPRWFFVSLWTLLMILSVVLLGMGIWTGKNLEIMAYRVYWVALLAMIGLSYACFFRTRRKLAVSDTLNIKEFGKATDESGKHRLVLNYVEVAHPEADKGSTFYDFYSLVWESMDDNWTERHVISKSDFEKGCERRRWVSKVHSIDSAGRAVLQVGEVGTPSATGEMRVIYSWREWDLTRNQEVRLIRVCRNPFDPFEGTAP